VAYGAYGAFARQSPQTTSMRGYPWVSDFKGCSVTQVDSLGVEAPERPESLRPLPLA
jgi:hypothetical protein